MARRLVAGLSLTRPGFYPRLIRVKFVGLQKQHGGGGVTVSFGVALSLFPPMLHGRVHLYVAVTRRTKGRNLRTFHEATLCRRSKSSGQKRTSTFLFRKGLNISSIEKWLKFKVQELIKSVFYMTLAKRFCIELFWGSIHKIHFQKVVYWPCRTVGSKMSERAGIFWGLFPSCAFLSRTQYNSGSLAGYYVVDTVVSEEPVAIIFTWKEPVLSHTQKIARLLHNNSVSSTGITVL